MISLLLGSCSFSALFPLLLICVSALNLYYWIAAGLLVVFGEWGERICVCVCVCFSLVVSATLLCHISKWELER